ncbi:MAG: 50S ribosomal protein L24 [Clostridium sp. SCN 57-10]|nr:MAG: 50S ribosomal protein L24 [Clostridium sp. SCN 57-10]
MNTLHVKKGDTVIVLSGKEKGKQGKVLRVDPTAQTVVIEGVNLVSKHQKPRKQGETGGIIKKENALRVCKVMRVCPKCDKPTRQASKFVGDKKVRVCKHCGAEI